MKRGKPMKRASLWLAAAALLLGAGPAAAQPKAIATIEVDNVVPAGTPICVPLSLPPEFGKTTEVTVRVVSGDPEVFKGPGQLTAPGLATEHIAPAAKGQVRRDLHLWFVPGKGAISKISVFAEPFDPKVVKKFTWQNKPGEYADLLLDTRPVMRYMYKAYDASSPENRDKTYKVFHHLYDPEGKRIVTNGGQTNDPLGDPKKLLYPHHRGLMYAFNQITYGAGKKCDTWHAKPGDTHEQHNKFLLVEAGSMLGRHRLAVDWHGPDNEVFAREERELTVYKVPGGTLVDFASVLRTAGGKVKLDGDPQHAGFQFRAHNDVAVQTAKETYYLRPDGKGKPGETRNWDPKTKAGPENLPWDAMSFVLGGQRYTAAYLSHPSDPKPSRWSERDYGRFGCYFSYDLTEQNPLTVQYRVWLQEGEMTGPLCEAMYLAFTSPPKAVLK
jgi:hypothetical protein